MNIILNKDKVISKIKPVHGISNGPLSDGGCTNTSAEYVEMGIPFVRLHDTDSPYPQQVDIYQIFRDFDKDPYDEKNYDFLLTDQFIKAIDGVGAKIIYRGIVCRLEDGTVAGSVLHLNKGVWNIYKNSKIPLHECVNCASLNPATTLGIQEKKA